jgi:hypothetical protein
MSSSSNQFEILEATLREHEIHQFIHPTPAVRKSPPTLVSSREQSVYQALAFDPVLSPVNSMKAVRNCNARSRRCAGGQPSLDHLCMQLDADCGDLGSIIDSAVKRDALNII